VTVKKILQLGGDVVALEIEPTPDFLRDGVRDVLRTVVRRIEHDHPQWIVVLPTHQISDRVVS
jgi:hypothetical protein